MNICKKGDMRAAKIKKISTKDRNLMRRYLLWCYKTTKEDLDRIDRYFTQAVVDQKLLQTLRREVKALNDNPVAVKKVDEFAAYMETKQKNVLPKKYLDPARQILQPEYWYLQTRFRAIEKAIVELLGKSELQAIEDLYEREMTRRILEAREHT